MKQKVKKVKIPKKKTDSQLKKELDSVFSQYIRLLYATKDGMVTCCTCGCVKHWKEMQNGHYESRQYLSLRYDDFNCFPQCVGCNIFKQGNYTEYARYLLRNFGPERLEYLNKKKQEITKYFPYQEKINQYKKLVHDLLKIVI